MLLIDNFLELQPGGIRLHSPIVGLKIPHTVEFSGLVTARAVSKTSIGLAIFSLYLERAVAETSTLTKQMARVGRAIEHREPWMAEHQLLCTELRSCIIFWTRSILPASIPLPFRIVALAVRFQQWRSPRTTIPCVLLVVWSVRVVSRRSARKLPPHSRQAPPDNSKNCR